MIYNLPQETRTYQCLECGNIITLPKGLTPGKMMVMTPYGPEVAGCGICGCIDYRPVLPVLPPEA